MGKKRGIFKIGLVTVIINFLLFSEVVYAEYFSRAEISEIKQFAYNMKHEQPQIIQGLLKIIDQYKHVPYRYGGDSIKGVDCSGFAKIVMHQLFGINLPKGSRNQVNHGERVPKDQLKAGDLVFFKHGSRVGHVGIYLFDGYFVSAESGLGKIGISRLDCTYWNKKYYTARRFNRSTVKQQAKDPFKS